MNDSCIVISSDSEDNGELPSLSFSSEQEVSDIDLPKLQNVGAGNPSITMSPKRVSSHDTGSSKKNRSDLIEISSEDDDDSDDFKRQKFTAQSIQVQPQEMCNDAASPGHSSAEATVQATTVSPSESTTVGVSEGSGDSESESDSSSDLEDFLPDLEPQSSSDMTQIGFCPRDSSSPRKPRKHKKERHFTDSFSSTSKLRKTGREAEPHTSAAASLPCAEQTAKSSTETVGRRTRQLKRRRDRISHEMQAGSSPMEDEKYSVFAFPDKTSPKPTAGRRVSKTTETESRRSKNRFSGVRFLQDVATIPAAVDRLCTDFVRLQSSCLDDLSDDLTDSNSFLNFIDLLEDFSYKRKPPSSLIEKVVNNGFFTPVEERVWTRSYVVVLKIWHMYPDLISIDARSVLVAGDVMKRHLQSSNSSVDQGRSSSSAARDGDTCDMGLPSFPQAKLFFQLFIKGLQLNLSECKLADQKSVSKSLAFAFLSSDSSQTVIRQVMHWLDLCLVVRQPQQVSEAKLWMCQLQALLSATVLVSKDRQETAKKLASELKRTYKYLTDLSVKKELVQSVSSPLLLFYFLRLVMEDQCESTIVSSQFPSSMHEVIHNYYLALPPQDHMTPPPSPSDDENAGAQGQTPKYSAQSCEELAMLIYFISKSFIACTQRRLNGDLRPQILKGRNLSALTPEEREKFILSVQEFRAHLRTLSLDLEQTSAMTYVDLLDSLCHCHQDSS